MDFRTLLNIKVPWYYYFIKLPERYFCSKVELSWCSTSHDQQKHICIVLLYTYHSSHLHILVVGENENDVVRFDAFWTPERAGEKSDEDTGGHDARAGRALTEARARHEAKIGLKSAQTPDLSLCVFVYLPIPKTRNLTSARGFLVANCSSRGRTTVGWAEKVWGSETLCVSYDFSLI